MSSDLSFGRWLKHRRLDLKLTQAELARQISYSIVTIRKIESGDLRPSRQIAERLADQLQLDPLNRAAFVRFARGEPGGELFAVPSAGAPVAQAVTMLPVPPTALVGRQRETGIGVRLLLRPDVRLLTLTGPGGTGKTRLAIHIAAELAEEFADGVYFVDLAPIADPALVASAIAAALGISETPGRPLVDILRHYLRDKRLLLLLDNFEHLLAGAAQVAQLLAAAPYLKILATSRTKLRLRAEHEFAVPPLAVPDLSGAHEAPSAALVDWVSQYPAVDLFVRCAEAALFEFRLTAENARAVAEICARIDGLPLAIELVAVRVKVLPPAALLAQLGNRLGMLVDGAQDRPARQQTLRDTLAWSHNLLSTRQQELFRNLGVFVGGATLAAVDEVTSSQVVKGNLAVRAVSSTTRTAASSTLDLVASLIHQSLLWQREVAGGEARFGMLETIREFAQEQLRDSGNAQVVQRRHAEFFLRLVEESEPLLRGPQQLSWLNRLELEHDNIRAALRWSIDNSVGEIALQMVGSLRWFWTQHSHVSEGLQWALEALERCGVSENVRPRAKALYSAGVMAMLCGDPRSRQFLEQSVALWRGVDDKRGLAYALSHLGLVVYREGEMEPARDLGIESVALFNAVGDKAGVALATFNLAHPLEVIEGQEAWEALAREAEQLCRQIGDGWGLALTLRQLGLLAIERAEYDEARKILTESFDLWREMNCVLEQAATLANLGTVARLLGDRAAARRLLGESLIIARRLGLIQIIAEVLSESGELAGEDGHLQRAATMQAATRALQDMIDKGQSVLEGDILRMPILLPDGAIMPLERICDYALADAQDS